MRILINALPVKIGGGITYIRNILMELAKIDSTNRYIVLSTHSLECKLPSNFLVKMKHFPFGSRFLRILWEQFVLPIYIYVQRIELLYSPHDMTTLLASCRVILALRNPVLYTSIKQDWQHIGDRLRIKVFSLLARRSAHKAHIIIFVSQDSRDWISSNLQLKQSKLRVVHHGIRVEEKSLSATNISVGRPKYILSVSNIYHYKNYLRLIESYARLLELMNTSEDLWIIGDMVDIPYYRSMKRKIVSLGLQERVNLVGGVPYERIFGYYRNAICFVFPSYLETFGHPMLEAMAMGVPLLASDIGVFREVGGNAARYFNPFDVSNMAEIMRTVLTDVQLQKEMVDKGFARVKHFSWAKAATETLRIFGE